MEVSQKPFTRKKPDQLVYLELGASNGGMLLSISEDGFRFRAVAPLRPNLQMPFAFSLDGNDRLEGTGVIEDLEEDGKSGGIRFTELSDQFRASLRSWLVSQPSATFTGREATPAASTPLDTMEKIRHELRNGHRGSPGQAAPTAAAAAAAAPDSRALAPEIILPISTPALWKEPAKPVVAESKSEFHEIKSPIGIFSEALPKQAEPAVSAPISSAFLKTRSTARPAPSAFEIPAVQASLNEPVISSAPKPYVPPLEPSFEQAWVQVKLNAPPDPPRLGRAASGTIIAVALAVILGALGYNFHQTIGGLLIELGQAISGENHGSATAPAQGPKADKPPVENTQAQTLKESPTVRQNSAAEKADAPASSETPAGGSSPNPTTPGSMLAKPSAKPSSAPPVDPNGKSSEPPEGGSGQKEFSAAQGILRGNKRSHDLPKAVDLLWAGVKKGYVPAEVTLGDLYRRGDGVPKNCAQATVLLTAASKKGSSDARKMLEQIAEKGCK